MQNFRIFINVVEWNYIVDLKKVGILAILMKILNISFPRMEPTTAAFIVARFYPYARTAFNNWQNIKKKQR